MKRKKKKVPAGGFQDVEVKVKMDENMTKKKKIAQENDSGNGKSKKNKTDQEQNALKKRKIVEEGDKGNNKKRKIDIQVDVQKDGDEVQKKRGKKGKQTVSTYDEGNVKEDVHVNEEVHKNREEVMKEGKKGKQTVSTDEGKQDVSTNNEAEAQEGNASEGDIHIRNRDEVSFGAKLDSEGNIQNKNCEEVTKQGEKGKQTASTDEGKQDVSTNLEAEGNASEGDVEKKNGENRDEDVKQEKFAVNADDDNEIIQNKSDGQQGKWDHGKEGKQDVSTGKQEGKQTVSTYHEADAESSDDENGDTYSQAIEAGDGEEDELLMEVLTHQPTEEDFVRWEEKYKKSKWIKEVTSDEDDEPICRSRRLEKKYYWQGGSQRQPWTETLKDKKNTCRK